MNRPVVDIVVEDHGTVVLLRGVTAEGRAWLEQNVQSDPWQWMGSAVAAEPRMARDVVLGAMDDGLTVRVNTKPDDIAIAIKVDLIQAGYKIVRAPVRRPK